MLNWIRKKLGFISDNTEKSTLKNTLKNTWEIEPRQRIDFEQMPDTVYAIGDVHGHLDLLVELERKIAADCQTSKSEALIIMLGDYVDRGPKTCALIDHLIDPPAMNARRICLAGNHEEIMQTFLNNPDAKAPWMGFGGRETLMSYGFDEKELDSNSLNRRSFTHKINSIIPLEHADFIRNLAVWVRFPEYIFVHAGIRPDVAMAAQSDRDLMWIRTEFLEYSGELNPVVVHGHSPTKKPFISASRINIDTGAYATGQLTAAKFTNGSFAEFLTI